jgi:hypothetical protein
MIPPRRFPPRAPGLKADLRPAPPGAVGRNPGGENPIRTAGGLLVDGTSLGGRLSDFEVTLRPDLDEVLRREAPPLALLPLRLEYRFVETGQKLSVADGRDIPRQRAAVPARRAGSDLRTRQQVEERPARMRQKEKAVPKYTKPPLASKEELWVRWYPEAEFSRDGVEAPTVEEQTALATFRAAVAGKDWWNSEEEAVSSAWQGFSSDVGAPRAIHLIRGHDSLAGEREIGRITAMPRRVAIFGRIKGKMVEIAQGTEIAGHAGAAPPKVSYTPEALEPGGWLADFATAVDSGMGVRISDPDAIANALAADWIIAIGLHSKDARAELNALFRDKIAGGSVAVLPQDSPTNNTASERSQDRRFRDNPAAFLKNATQAEQGAFTEGASLAADLLSEALDLDSETLQTIVSGADSGFEDTRAMLRVIGPVLLDGSLDGKTAFGAVSENELIDIMAAAISARGALPAVRFGRNAYGIVPVTKLSELDISEKSGFAKPETQVFGSLAMIGSLLRDAMLRDVDDRVAVLAPDNPQDAASKLEAILQSGRVSRRLDLIQGDETKALGCPYVTGGQKQHQPANYLLMLRTTAISWLPDPAASNRQWPLLYRLARLSMTRNMAQVLEQTDELERADGLGVLGTLELKTDTEQRRIFEGFDRIAGELGLATGPGGDRRPGQPAPSRLDPQTAELAQRLFGAFDSGLARLAKIAAQPNGPARLEMLMLEVFDLFQHRVDAWLTGIAYARLVRRRAVGGTGLRAGYYGILGNLRKSDPNAQDDGYIQAPSMAQATTAAILRSAYRRHEDNGAFDLDLSSARIRRAMAVIDHLTAGATLSAALGLRAERLLREMPRNASHLIPAMRRIFPMVNAAAAARTQTNRSGEPMLDGLALIDATGAGMAVDIRAAWQAIQPQIKDDLDAVSDIVMAEAVHHRAHGAADVANAWLSVLSGGRIPGKPAFIKLQRPSHASSHRLALVLPQAALPAATAAPRRIAEPALAALADRLVPQFAALKVIVRATRVDDPLATAVVELNLRNDLGMAPIDLMVGGENELRLRAKTTFSERWRAEDASLAALGALSETLRAEDLAMVELDQGPLSEPLSKVLATLQSARKIAAQGRPLAPSDLNAAALARVGELPPAVEIEIVTDAANEMQARATRLAAALDASLAAVRQKLVATRAALSQLALEISRDPTAPVVTQRRAQAHARRDQLVALLTRLAAFAAPEVLGLPTVEVLLSPTAMALGRLDRTLARLTKKSAALRNLAPVSSSRLEDARASLTARVKVLQTTLDGDVLPVLPVYSTRPQTKPAMRNAGILATAQGALAPWAGVRTKVDKVLQGLGPVSSSMSLYKVIPEATQDPAAQNEDARGEDESPPVRHFGIMISTVDLTGTLGRICGIVADEWVESRPSSQQDSAVALNYNTPDAHAPNAILLCIPPNPQWKSWTQSRAVSMVSDVIDLMRIRALTSDQRLVQTALTQDCNTVPQKPTANGKVNRIPTRNLILDVLGRDNSVTGLFVLAGDGSPQVELGIAGTGLNLTGGSSGGGD